MANRKALRELQSRLAARLRSAHDDSRQASWLAVESGGRGFLLALASAGEIFPVSALKAVPHTQGWFVGVANLRGGLHGVVDLAGFLGLPEGPSAEPAREQSRLVAFGAALGLNGALLVDRLAGLRSSDQMSVAPADGVARPAFAGAVWLDAAQRAWQSLDLARLARDEHFLSIVA